MDDGIEFVGLFVLLCILASVAGVLLGVLARLRLDRRPTPRRFPLCICGDPTDVHIQAALSDDEFGRCLACDNCGMYVANPGGVVGP